MRTRGCLLGLLGVLVGLAVVAAVVDVGARHYATSRVEQRISTAVPGAQGVSAHIHSWPFLKVGVGGHIDEIGARLTRVVVRPVVFTDLHIDLRGVRVATTSLVSEGKLQVTHIDGGTIQVSLTAADLAAALGLPAGILAAAGLAGGTAVADAIGRVASVDADRRQLVVSIPGVRRFTLPLPGPDLVPCIPRVTAVTTGLSLSCTFTRVPAALTASPS